MEEWKEIIGYENSYWISNLGNVKSKRKQLKLTINKDGYYIVNLSKKGKSKVFNVHRLVAIHFIKNPNNLEQVNHKDENKLNNCVSNLEWCTLQQNHNYGTRNTRTGISQRNNSRSKAVLQYDLNMNFIQEFPSVSEIQRQFMFNHNNIIRCCNGKYTQAYGYIWKFK